MSIAGDENAELREKVEFLSRPEAHAGENGPIDVLETHFAWLFLGSRFVYKLKKPLRYHDVDFSTRDLRRRVCELEVSLNRRLAEEVYVATVPLVRRDGGLWLDGPGEPVDWLVKMRRLDSRSALDVVAQRAGPTATEIAALVGKLHRFHAGASRVAWTASAYADHLSGEVRQWDRSIRSSLGARVPAELAGLVEPLLGFIGRSAALLGTRVAGGFVVDGHGDLRPEHIFLSANPQIIDCIEFSSVLRLLDVAEEIGFLDLECERLGKPALGRRIAEAYWAASGARPAIALYAFYRARRALGRAMIASWRIAASPSEEETLRWGQTMAWYLSAGQQSVRGVT